MILSVRKRVQAFGVMLHLYARFTRCDRWTYQWRRRGAQAIAAPPLVRITIENKKITPGPTIWRSFLVTSPLRRCFVFRFFLCFRKYIYIFLFRVLVVAVVVYVVREL